MTNNISNSSNIVSLFYYTKLHEKSLSPSETPADSDRALEQTETTADSNVEYEKALERLIAPVNKSYRAPGPHRLHLVDSYENGDTVWACEDRTSTSQNPVIYVETVEAGVQQAYLVAVDKIDLSSMTKIEGYALARYTGINIGAPYGDELETGAELGAGRADYLKAVRKNIANYQRSVDSAIVNFARSIYESLEKPCANAPVLREFFL
jgi:hypothetical protein